MRSKKKSKNPIILVFFLVIILVLVFWIYNNNNNSTSKNSNWNLILINSENSVPDNYQFKQLTIKNGHIIDERIYPDLQKMFDDARAEGVDPIVTSAYRTIEEQQEIYDSRIEKHIEAGSSTQEAIDKTRDYVALPHHSEHHTGLAVDINSESGNNQIVYDWLAKNSYRYGFILRYLESKENLTGINFEPWHFRYVGIDEATYITEKSICFEEYIDEIE